MTIAVRGAAKAVGSSDSCIHGMPCRATEARTFERTSGHISVQLKAGKLWNGKEWVKQPLPYGTTPRLVMVHISSEAIRTQSRDVDVGDSMQQFLLKLGMGDGGGPRGGYGRVFQPSINASMIE
jgi:hypothetical protein